MKIKKIKYLIVSMDEKMFVHALGNWNNGLDYTIVTFDLSYKFAKQFTSKKLAEIAQQKMLNCSAPFFVTKSQDYIGKAYSTMESLPKTKIVKLIINMEDVK